MRTPLATLVLLTLPLTALAADPAASAPAPDEIGSLIHDLASDTYQTREAATEKLISLGEPALPRLQKLLPLTTDGETRNRIQSAIDQILESAAAGPTLLTLDVKDADARTVFAELSKQAHAEIRVASDLLDNLPRVTFRCDREPFWPALKRLCAPLQLAPESINLLGVGAFGRRPSATGQSADHALTLVKAGDAWDKTPTTFDGPFMICVQRVTRTGVVLPATGQNVHNVMVECVVHAEPKLTVVGRSPVARVTVPDPANPVPGGAPAPAFFRGPFASRGTYYNPSGAPVWSLLVPVSVARDAADKLPQLKATTSARVLVRSDSWELPDIARAAPRSWTAAGRTFTVTAVRRQDDRVELTATATRRPDRTPNDPDDNSVFNALELLDPGGRALAIRSRSPQPTDDPRRLAYGLTFDATPEGAPLLPANTPLRLRWRLPLEAKDVEMAIEFTDLPLP
jgi:hypothetical protein